MIDHCPRDLRSHSIIVGAFVLLVLLGGISATAHAQPWPSRPVRLIAASSPGSGVDLVARVLAQKLAEPLGQQVVVDNRAGAGGNLGAEIAAKAAADGYTLFMGTPAHAINAALYRKLSYDIVRDFVPVSLATTGHYVLVVNPTVPARSVKEFLALARARPGKLNYASAGAGNATHLAGELLRSMTGIDIVHVPYKGSGPALSDVIAGHVPVMMSNILIAQPHIRSGRVRAYGVSSLKRLGSAPDIPTLHELGFTGFEAEQWFGIFAPAATPREAIDILHGSIVKALQDPGVRERFARDGAVPAPSASPEAFTTFVRAELTRWARVVREAKIQP